MPRGLVGKVVAPWRMSRSPSTPGSRRRVYDADAIKDSYIRHLHERIAALHAQLHDGIPEEAPATPDGGRTAKAPRPTWQSLLGRGHHLAPVAPRPHRDEDQRYPWLDEEDADRPVPTAPMSRRSSGRAPTVWQRRRTRRPSAIWGRDGWPPAGRLTPPHRLWSSAEPGDSRHESCSARSPSSSYRHCWRRLPAPRAAPGDVMATEQMLVGDGLGPVASVRPPPRRGAPTPCTPWPWCSTASIAPTSPSRRT